MLHTISGSGEEIFKYIYYLYFYGSNTGPPGERLFWMQRPLFEQTW